MDILMLIQKKGNPLLFKGLNVEVVQRALIVRNMSES